MIKPWRILKRKVIYAAPPFVELSVETVELPDGRVISDYHHIETGDFVSIVAETADRRIMVLRQYRHGVRRTGLALPGGRVDAGETPLAAARRELLEEVGAEAPFWRAMSSWATSCTYGFSTSHYFHATDATVTRTPASDDLEQGELTYLTRDEIHRALKAGEFVSMGQAMPLALLLADEAGAKG
ncbi:MAG TPA: NUDIX hydrolase [Stellaceae bacterium]|nr:NUDIX hydrolase [Stellaceae bacterium]